MYVVDRIVRISEEIVLEEGDRIEIINEGLAEDIRTQLLAGLTKIGAKNFHKGLNVKGNAYLGFIIQRNPKDINYVEISLNDDGLFDTKYVSYGARSGNSYQIVKAEEGLEFNNILDSIERNTGIQINDFEDQEIESTEEIADEIFLESLTCIKNILSEEVNAQEIIKDFINTEWSKAEDQGKAVAMFKGLMFSKDPASDKFMVDLDKLTSKMKAEDYK